MEHTSPESIRKQIRIYVAVFAALAVLTIVTVAVSYLQVPFHVALLLALAIAAIKGTLVAAYFMHLISERWIVLALLAITVFFLAHMLLLPFFTQEGALVSHVA